MKKMVFHSDGNLTQIPGELRILRSLCSKSLKFPRISKVSGEVDVVNPGIFSRAARGGGRAARAQPPPPAVPAVPAQPALPAEPALRATYVHAPQTPHAASAARGPETLVGLDALQATL